MREAMCRKYYQTPRPLHLPIPCHAMFLTKTHPLPERGKTSYWILATISILIYLA